MAGLEPRRGRRRGGGEIRGRESLTEMERMTGGVSLVVVDDGRVRLLHELCTAGLPEDHLSRLRAKVEGESPCAIGGSIDR